MFGPTTNIPRRQKTRVAVELLLADGSQVIGHVFVGQHARVSDELNDDRRFLPVELGSGRVVNLSKASIVRVAELPPPEGHRRLGGSEPHALLGVSRESSDDEVKQAYTELARAYHPDRWANSHLPREAMEALNLALARVNEAYHLIMQGRRYARANAQERGSTQNRGEHPQGGEE